MVVWSIQQAIIKSTYNSISQAFYNIDNNFLEMAAPPVEITESNVESSKYKKVERFVN